MGLFTPFPLQLRPASLQFFDHLLIAAIEVIQAMYFSFIFSHKAGKNKSG